jgi:hypothetical protein
LIFIDIIIIPNTIEQKAVEPLPIHVHGSQHDQERDNDASVAYNGPQVIYTKPDPQQDSKGEKQAEIDDSLLLGPDLFSYHQGKNKKE